MTEWRRYSLLCLLVVLLAGSLVAFGTVRDVPADSIRDKQTKEVLDDPVSHVGEMVIVDGAVARTDPLVVRLTDGEIRTLSVSNVDGTSLSVGDGVYVVGRLVAVDHVDAERVLVEKPWEVTLMYVMSLLGGLMVLAGLVFFWRFDRRQLAFVPRRSGTRGEDG